MFFNNVYMGATKKGLFLQKWSGNELICLLKTGTGSEGLGIITTSKLYFSPLLPPPPPLGYCGWTTVKPFIILSTLLVVKCTKKMFPVYVIQAFFSVPWYHFTILGFHLT